MLRILLFLTVVVLIAGGGAAGWWFGLRGEPFPFASAQAADDGPAAAGHDVRFVELDPLTFPVMRDGQVRELVTYAVQLEVAGPAAEDALAARAPAVRDAMLSELYGLYAYRFTQHRPDEMTLVKRRLKRAAGEAAGTDVRSVLLQGLNTRPQQARRP